MELKQFKIAVLPLRDKLLSYARKLTDDHSDAEDAVQEVMLKLWNLRPKLDEYHSIEALAMTMTHHTCMDILRGKHPDNLSLDSVQAASPVATPERLLEEKDEFSLMRHIISTLPPLQQTIPPDERCRRVRNRRNRRDNRMQLRSHPQQFIQGTEKVKRHLPANHTTKKKEKRSMNIEELLNKYFEGETTCEEERELRCFSPGASYRNICRCTARCLLSSTKRTGRARLPSPKFRKLLSLCAAVYFTYSAEWLPEYCLYWVLPVSTDISTPQPLIM